MMIIREKLEKIAKKKNGNSTGTSYSAPKSYSGGN